MNSRLLTQIVSLVAAMGVLVISLSSAVDALGFADDGEFAIATYLGSSAHPPGFPAYIWIGWLWGKIATLFSASHVWNMVVFSSVCTAGMAYLLTRTLAEMLPGGEKDRTNILIGAISAVVLVSGVTVRLWSNTVEVYAFQMFAMGLLLFGLAFFHTQRKMKYVWVAALGLGLGLANHHLTMILFIPFIFFFFGKKLLLHTPENPSKPGFAWKELMYMSIGSGLIVMLFYSVMVVRSNAVLPFEFGNPDNVARFWNHLRGGYWASQTVVKIEGIMAMRLPYFLNLILEEYFLFIPFLILGIIYLAKNRKFGLLTVSAGYFLIILIYQLRIYQFADTDSYMLLPFMLGTICLVFGIYMVVRWRPVLLLPVAILAGQIFYLSPKTDKKNYAISDTLMADLDRSAPLNSIVLVSDWTMAGQYYFYRIAENFRPDLVVLKDNIKFTNHEMLEAMYPDFYAKVKEPYSAYINAIRKHHPGMEYDTGVVLDHPEIITTYRALIEFIITEVSSQEQPFLRDPGTFQFHYEGEITTDYGLLSGVFFSIVDTHVADDFIHLNIPWLDSPLLIQDPAAINTLADYETLLEVYRNKFEAVGDPESLAVVKQSSRRIKVIQKKMKRVMPFIGAENLKPNFPR